MNNKYVYDWDEIAPYWSTMENNGMTMGTYKKVRGEIQFPLAIVGCGSGLLLKNITDEMGKALVWGYDTSSNMLSKLEQTGYENVSSPLQSDEKKFNTVIITTGVIDGMTEEQIKELIDQYKKKTISKGKIILTSFSKSGKKYEIANEMGVIEEDGICYGKILKLCSRQFIHGEKMKWSDTVDWIKKFQINYTIVKYYKLAQNIAKEKAISEEKAIEWLKEVMPKIQRLFAADELFKCMAESGCMDIQKLEFDIEGVNVLIGTIP